MTVNNAAAGGGGRGEEPPGLRLPVFTQAELEVSMQQVEVAAVSLVSKPVWLGPVDSYWMERSRCRARALKCACPRTHGLPPSPHTRTHA